MSKTQKIKKIIVIAIGFGLSTYLLINGFALLKEEQTPKQNSSLHNEESHVGE